MASLRKHVKEVREEIKKYHCTECGIKVSRKYHLIRHIKAVHHKEKFWRCEDCVIIRQTIKFVSKSISKPNMKLVVIVIYFTVWSHYKIFLKEWLKQIWSVSVLGVYSKVTSTVLSRSTLRLIMKGRIIIHVKNVFLLDKVWMTMPSITIHSTRLIVTHMLAQIVASSALTNMIWSDITVTRAWIKPYFLRRASFEYWDLKRSNIQTFRIFEPPYSNWSLKQSLPCFKIIYSL